MKKLILKLTLFSLLLITACFAVSCGDGEEPAAGAHAHEFGEWTESVSVTCGVDGKDTRACACGAVEERAVPATGAHAFSEWTLSVPAGCATEGEEIRTCVCGAKEERHIAPLGEHAFGDWTVSVPAECLADGKQIRTCDCGAVEEKMVPAAGAHGFGEWTVLTPASCIAEGKEIRACVCGLTEERPIPMTEKHAYGADNSCTVCGYRPEFTKTIVYTLTEDGEGYTVTDADEAATIVVPAYYAGKPVVAIGDRAFAQMTSLKSITLPETVTYIGSGAFYGCASLETLTCFDLDVIGEDAFTGCRALTEVPHVHEYGEWTVFAASECLTLGEERRSCLWCKRYESRPLSAAGHVFGEWTVTEPATCEKDGVVTRACGRCTYSERDALASGGHSYGEWISEVPATCTERGVLAHYHCDACGTNFDKDKNVLEDIEIPATDHDMGEWDEISAAKCEKNGYCVRLCADCNFYETHVLAADGHKMGEWTVEILPTADSDGERFRTCERCGYKEWEIIERSDA